MLVEQEGTYREGVLVVDGEVGILFGPAVELGVPEFDVRLVGEEAHGVSAFFPGCVLPEGRVFEALV